MPSSIGVNLRVTGHSCKGDRKYMEDFFSVAYQQSEDEKDLEYAFFGIYDGHGGQEAAVFAKEHLMNSIVQNPKFWSEDDDEVLKAIHEGYLATHHAMWRIQEKWPRTSSGLLSTAGTTASVAFIRHGKIYIGHVGDSGIILGYQQNETDKFWTAEALTIDHKPESTKEQSRIQNSGGKVVVKSGVPRVVWNRPRIGHRGPVRRSTPIDEIPFLAVARSLGDLWSYNSNLNEFVVSPEPDVRVLKIDAKKFRCLIFGTDGLWNVMLPGAAVEIVRHAETMNDSNTYAGGSKEWRNPSKCLVDRALQMWTNTRMRADNTSVVTVMLDPAGPPKKEALKTNVAGSSQSASTSTADPNSCSIDYAPYIQQVEDRSATLIVDHSTHKAIDMEGTEELPASGLAVMTRYETHTTAESAFSNAAPMDYAPSSVPAGGEASTSSANMEYMDSFAESYNSLLTSSLNDHSYTPEFAHNTAGEQQRVGDETYSLTNLQTRTERLQQAATSPPYYAPNRDDSDSDLSSFADRSPGHGSDYEPEVHYLTRQNCTNFEELYQKANDEYHMPMERYDYLQTNANVYHTINNSNPPIEPVQQAADARSREAVDARSREAAEARSRAAEAPTPTNSEFGFDDSMMVEIDEDEEAEERANAEGGEPSSSGQANISDDQINNNKNDDEESIQIHEITSSNNLASSMVAAVLAPPEDEASCDITTTHDKENVVVVVKKPPNSKTPAHHLQSPFHEKKDTRSNAFRLRNGKKLSEMVDSSKKVKRKVKGLFVTPSTSKKAGDSVGRTPTGGSFKARVQNFTNKTMNLVQTVMKENLRSSRSQPRPGNQQPPPTPKTPPPPTKATTSKKELRRTIGEKLTNLSMRSASVMKRSKSAMKMSTRKSSATTKSTIPFLLTPTLPTLQVNLRRLRQSDINKDFALQEKNTNEGFDVRNTRRRTTIGVTSTPAKVTTKTIQSTPSDPTPVRAQTKRLSARNNPWCPPNPIVKSATPAAQSAANKKVQKRVGK